jgi:hypothetical protein
VAHHGDVPLSWSLFSLVAALVAVTTGALFTLIMRMDALATGLRSEMRDMRSELRADIGGVRTEMHGMRADLRAEMHGLRAEVRAALSDVDRRLRGGGL